MLIVTGGAGFLGSAVIWKLNQAGLDDILVVDNLGTGEKWRNLAGRRFADIVTKEEFLARIEEENDPYTPRGVIHMGACSSTTERDAGYLMENNYRYSLAVARYCLARGVRLVYASSAATYGDGSLGFDDDPEGLDALRPLNIYGYSKHRFDLAARRHGWLDAVAGLKFFNVYGPNEYHKGDMMSVVRKAFVQARDTGTVRLFKSYSEATADGGQLRDFVYVKDCVEVVVWLLEHPEACGLFNVGTGRARSFNDLARAVFAAMERPERIAYIDMPATLRGRYQDFTEARMGRLRAAGYERAFTSLEDGVKDYVRGYLAGNNYL